MFFLPYYASDTWFLPYHTSNTLFLPHPTGDTWFLHYHITQVTHDSYYVILLLLGHMLLTISHKWHMLLTISYKYYGCLHRNYINVLVKRVCSFRLLLPCWSPNLTILSHTDEQAINRSVCGLDSLSIHLIFIWTKNKPQQHDHRITKCHYVLFMICMC